MPSLERGTFDMAMNGLELTPSRTGRVLFSRPEGVEEPYFDLVQKRTDAVRMDDIIARRYGETKPELRVVGSTPRARPT